MATERVGHGVVDGHRRNLQLAPVGRQRVGMPGRQPRQALEAEMPRSAAKRGGGLA